jgi:hypothetical protein
MKYIISLLFLILAISTSQAQISYTESGWTAQDSSYLIVRENVAGATTWYQIDKVDIGSNGFQTRTSITPPMTEAQLLEYITAWKADADNRATQLDDEQAILSAALAILNALEDTLTE